MPVKPLRIATRTSPLAMAQAKQIQSALADWSKVPADAADQHFPIIGYVTTGDQRMDPSLARIGGKGLFTKEIERALLDGQADIAVHSMKDLPADMPEGLILAGVPAREDPRDALVSASGVDLKALPEGASVGTSSIRRAAQTRRLRPDLRIVPMRGNVQTRLGKLEAGDATATFLAEAGLKRLDLKDVPRTPVPTEVMLPALCQGLLALQTREDDTAAREAAEGISAPEALLVAGAERAVLKRLGGSCRTPVAGLAELSATHLVLKSVLLSPRGNKAFEETTQLSRPTTASGVTALMATAPAGETVGEAFLSRIGGSLDQWLEAPR